MKRILGAALGLALLAVPVWAALGYTSVSATSTAQTTTINASTLVVVNDDATNEVYVRVFVDGETVADATTASAEIKKGESFTFTKDFNIKAISIVCASGETATVRLFYW